MVPTARIELAIDDYESTVIPLNYAGAARILLQRDIIFIP